MLNRYGDRSEIHFRLMILGGAEVAIGNVDSVKQSVEARRLRNRPCSVEALPKGV
jgi:hypothetical protein